MSDEIDQLNNDEDLDEVDDSVEAEDLQTANRSHDPEFWHFFGVLMVPLFVIALTVLSVLGSLSNDAQLADAQSDIAAVQVVVSLTATVSSPQSARNSVAPTLTPLPPVKLMPDAMTSLGFELILQPGDDLNVLAHALPGSTVQQIAGTIKVIPMTSSRCYVYKTMPGDWVYKILRRSFPYLPINQSLPLFLSDNNGRIKSINLIFVDQPFLICDHHNG